MRVYYYNYMEDNAYSKPIIYIMNTAVRIDLRRNTDHITQHLVLLFPVHSET